MSSLDTARPLLLGLGWSPDQPGGLNRYFGDLLRALGDPAAVVVGPRATRLRTPSSCPITPTRS